jgi:hypothetical protein
MDVEDLVCWACAELARKRPGNVHVLPVLNIGRGDRDCLGKWDRPMGFPPASPMFSGAVARAGGARGDPPHPDSLLVEAAIGALRLTPGAEDFSAVTQGLGFDLDARGALDYAFANAGNLIVVHGRLGSRPSLPEASTPRAKLASNGRPAVFVIELASEPMFGGGHLHREVETPATSTKRKDHYPNGAYCRLDWEADPQTMLNDRAEYWAWGAGLAALAVALADRLETRAALPLAAPRAPWRGEADAGAVVSLLAGAPAARRRYGRERMPGRPAARQ